MMYCINSLLTELTQYPEVNTTINSDGKKLRVDCDTVPVLHTAALVWKIVVFKASKYGRSKHCEENNS